MNSANINTPDRNQILILFRNRMWASNLKNTLSQDGFSVSLAWDNETAEIILNEIHPFFVIVELDGNENLSYG